MNEEELKLLEYVFSLAVGEAYSEEIDEIILLQQKIICILEENQKYKEVIDKALEYIEQHAITVTDGTITTNKHELLDILKEVE